MSQIGFTPWDRLLTKSFAHVKPTELRVDPTGGPLAHMGMPSAEASANQINTINQGPPQQSISGSYHMRVARGQSPTVNGGRTPPTGPMADSISKAKEAARNLAMQQGMSDDQSAQLDALQSNPNIGLSQFEEVMHNYHNPKAPKQPKQANPEASMKRQSSIAADEQELASNYGQGITQPLDPAQKFDSRDVQADYLSARNRYKQLSDEATNLARGNRPAEDQTQGAGEQEQSDGGWTHPQTGQRHEEGAMLHSPSTGKTYRVRNGQPVEVTNE